MFVAFVAVPVVSWFNVGTSAAAMVPHATAPVVIVAARKLRAAGVPLAGAVPAVPEAQAAITRWLPLVPEPLRGASAVTVARAPTFAAVGVEYASTPAPSL
jgi:hypothetical protein